MSLKYYMHIFKRLEPIHLPIFMCQIVRSHLGHRNEKRAREVQALEFESGPSIFTINKFSMLQEKTKQLYDKTYTSIPSDHIKRFLVKKLARVHSKLLINELVSNLYCDLLATRIYNWKIQTINFGNIIWSTRLAFYE